MQLLLLLACVLANRLCKHTPSCNTPPPLPRPAHPLSLHSPCKLPQQSEKSFSHKKCWLPSRLTPPPCGTECTPQPPLSCHSPSTYLPHLGPLAPCLSLRVRLFILQLVLCHPFILPHCCCPLLLLPLLLLLFVSLAARKTLLCV